jgi:hypothetical protein
LDTKNLVLKAKERFAHQQSKLQLESKYDNQLIVANQNGLFKATPELIGFLASQTAKTVILVDEYRNPVKVKRNELLTLLNEKYSTIMEQWYDEHTELNKK